MPLPHVPPLPLLRAAEPFDDLSSIFELKHDGFRAIAYLECGKPARFVSRRGIDYKSYAELGAALRQAMSVSHAILDGELVVLDDDGRSLFTPLLRRRAAPVFYAFDVVWLNGRDLRELPLIRRKRLLRELLPVQSAHVLYADHVVGRGTDLFRAICMRDCEGIVAKLAESPYRLLEGRSPWVKVLNPRYTQKDGRVDQFLQRRGRQR